MNRYNKIKSLTTRYTAGTNLANDEVFSELLLASIDNNRVRIMNTDTAMKFLSRMYKSYALNILRTL